ncbi:hypothetical protein B296_00045641 [Ensete ventricosum]|uniref:Uncharacterized protein n=1 Tax=Ensete ventricosum TaxID=4639 RepID=A0A426YQR8_ENSVE|nr:hypothetical protein B296_00045641 [Ensete ventricosum]
MLHGERKLRTEVSNNCSLVYFAQRWSHRDLAIVASRRMRQHDNRTFARAGARSRDVSPSAAPSLKSASSGSRDITRIFRARPTYPDQLTGICPFRYNKHSRKYEETPSRYYALLAVYPRVSVPHPLISRSHSEGYA